MKDWYEFELISLIDIIGGGTPKTTKPEYWGGQIPWLSVVDFGGDDRYVSSTEKSITELGLKESSTKLLKKGDLVISARGTVGELAQLTSDMTFNQSCYGLRAIEWIDNDFLYYLMKYKLRALRRNVHGGVFDTITMDTFKLIKCLVPKEKDELKEITKTLSNLDDKITLLKEQNETLEELAQALFKRWFVEFEFPISAEQAAAMGKPELEGKPYNSSGGKMIDSELGEIPDGWGVGEIGDFVSHSTKSINPSANPDFEYRHYSIPAYDSGKYPTIDLGVSILSNKYLVSENAILVSKLNPSTSRIWQVINPKSGSICSTEIQVFIPNEHTYSFAFGLFHSAQVKREMAQRASGTSSSHQRIRPSDILNIESVVPSNEIILQFNQVAYPLILKTVENLEKIQSLTQLRDTLLPKLMSGELRVKN